MDSSEKEILTQIRMSVAVLEDRSARLDGLCDKLDRIDDRISKLESDASWIKKVVYSAIPVAPIMAGLGAVLSKMLGER